MLALCLLLSLMTACANKSSLEKRTSLKEPVVLNENQLNQQEAWNNLKEVYFNDINKENITFDDSGNIKIVIASWQQCFGDETQERLGETVVFLDGEEDNFYNFGCFKEYFNKDGTLFATQTQAWYKVDVNTGTVEQGP